MESAQARRPILLANAGEASRGDHDQEVERPWGRLGLMAALVARYSGRAGPQRSLSISSPRRQVLLPDDAVSFVVVEGPGLNLGRLRLVTAGRGVYRIVEPLPPPVSTSTPC